jgi:hypothetical protein
MNPARQSRPTSVEITTKEYPDDNSELRICWEVRFEDHVPLPYNWRARFKSAIRIECFSDDPGDTETTEITEDEAEELLGGLDHAMENAAEEADRVRRLGR